MAGFQKLVLLRILLVIPLTLLLALLIMTDNVLYRALMVAGLVVLELVRDALSLGEAMAVATGLPRKRAGEVARIKEGQRR